MPDVAGLQGEVVITPDVTGAFAQEVVAAFARREQDTFSLALTGSDDARACYLRPAADAEDLIDWWKVDIYWADERCIPHDHEDSNYRMARESLLDRVGAANATHLMRCAEGPDSYQLRLGDLGRLDLVHLGLGADGHLAALFAGSEALDTDPGRLVSMSEDPSGSAPYQRMTLTPGGLARSRTILITVPDGSRAEALAAVASGADVPASRIDAAHVRWIVHPDAAAGIQA